MGSYRTLASQVRSVSATSLSDPQDTLLLSASRDGNGRVWSHSHGSKSKRELLCRNILEGHEGFVNSCAWLTRDGIGEIASGTLT